VQTRTACGRWIGGLLVFAHSREAPSDTEWEELLALFRFAAEQGGRVRALVYTDGGAPNARQRARLNALLAGIKPRVALLTASAAARAIGVAVSWFNPEVRIFAGDEIGPALDHLSVNHGERRILTQALSELRLLNKTRSPA
jgi:hypothetical protein